MRKKLRQSEFVSHNLRFGGKICFVFFALILFSACTKGRGDNPTWEYMSDMMDQASIKAQEESGMMPPKNSVPRNYQAYGYGVDEGDKAGAELQNPIAITKESLVKGMDLYNTYCIVCHGPQGKGDGTIVPKFPMPPTLHSKKVMEWSDGRIFHVITKGQNLMPSYATQIFPEERWAIINYVRALQRSVNPTEADVKAYEDYKAGLK